MSLLLAATPPVRHLVITGFAPTVTQGGGGGGTSIVTAVGALAITGFAPTLSGSASSQQITVNAGALAFTGYAPSGSDKPVGRPRKKRRKHYEPVVEPEVMLKSIRVKPLLPAIERKTLQKPIRSDRLDKYLSRVSAAQARQAAERQAFVKAQADEEEMIAIALLGLL